MNSNREINPKEIREYYDQQVDYDPNHFDWKIEHYKPNQAISLSFDWLTWTGKSALDIGCGVGYYAIPLSKKCVKLTGIDISGEAIKAARLHASRWTATNVEFIEANIFDYQPDEPFDIAYEITCLMHITDLKKALKKIYSFLKPGGYFLMSDLNAYFLTNMLFRKRRNHFLRQFTLKETKRSLQQCGFRITRESGRIYSLFGKRKPDWTVFLGLERWAENWPLKFMGEHIVILAEKVR